MSCQRSETILYKKKFYSNLVLSCDYMDCSTSGFPVLHCLPEFALSCLLSWWWYSTISYSVTHFFSCPQSFPVAESFPVSQLFTSSGQSIGASTSTSDLSVNIQSWFPLGFTGLISLLSKELSRIFSSATFLKNQILGTQISLW